MDYYAKWYQEKKDAVCAKKREQYRTDPVLRERKRAKALERYHRLKTDSRQALTLSPI
jgi:hypothetical protein